jgi:REP element-mobilizing transposase RayT
MDHIDLPERRNNPPRLAKEVYGYSGVPNHLVVGTYGEQPWFARRPELTPLVAGCLHETAAWCGVEVFCYCLMPTHLHLVAAVEPGGKSLDRFMQSLKKRSALAAREVIGDRLWQRGFYDRFLRREEVLYDVCLYVLNNPVEAGLARDWRDYPGCWLSPAMGT